MQRKALSALQPVRAMLWSALAVALLACTLVVLAWNNGRRPPSGLILVAATALPLGLGAWQFTRRPLLVRSCFLRGAFVAACALIYFTASPTTLPWIAAVSLLVIGGWYSPVKRTRIREFLVEGTFPACVGAFSIGNSTLQLLAMIWFALALGLQNQHHVQEAVAPYLARGGGIEDLYRTARPEDRRVAAPGAVLVVAFFIAMSIAGLLSIRNASLTVSSSPGTIGIGGGK